MTLFAPTYYSSFRCIADQCKHTCCAGWEIDVDEKTLQKYEILDSDYAPRIRESIVQGEDGTPQFRLCAEERCPHLNESGLCRIILSHGEEYLCDICREHPRFYNDTVRGCEVGLGLVCEEACRLILTASDYTVQPLTPTDSAEYSVPTESFDAIHHRTRIYSVLKNPALPYSERLDWIMREYRVSPALLADGDARSLLRSLEYLNEENRTVFAEGFSQTAQRNASLAPHLERALAYFLYRHASAASDALEFRAALGLALFLEQLLSSLAERNDNIFEIARTISEEIEYSEDNTEAILEEFAVHIE